MKKTPSKIILMCSVLCANIALSQSGLTRNEAITVQPQGLCNYSDFTTQGTEMWFQFVAQSEKVAIELKSEKFGNNMGHIHNLKLFKGTDVIERAQDELPFNAESDKLKVNLNAGNLIIGETYVLRADRKANIGECNKAYCHGNNSTNPAQIRLCVQNINVFIPNDENAGLPSNSHGYELNRGQLYDDHGHVINEIVMYTQHTTPQIYLADRYTSLLWSKIDSDSTTLDSLHRVDMELVGGQMNDRILKSEELPSFNNYYFGQDSKGILVNKSYSRAVRQSVYNNIDQHYYSNQDGLKMYFVVYPGGNHEDIKIKFTGGATTELTATGGLKVKSPFGEMLFKKAEVYYTNPGENNVPMPQSGNFIDLGNNEFGFHVSNYTNNRILVIELEKESPTRSPEDAEWCTYFGGNGADRAQAMDLDPQKNLYVTGTTGSIDFPSFGGPDLYQADLDGTSNGFVAKFDEFYERKWATYVGGANTGHIDLHGISVDNTTQSVYVAGKTYMADVPTHSLAGSPNSFVDASVQPSNQKSIFSRFKNSNGELEWMTLFPGIDFNDVKVKVDGNGNVFFAGQAGNLSTQVAQGPVTCSPTNDGTFPQCNSNPASYKQFRATNEDIYIAKFNPQLELVWSTHFGGDNRDWFYDMAIDNVNNYLYIVGATRSTIEPTLCPNDNVNLNFPLCNPGGGGFFQTVPQGDYDGFITRFTLDGELNWSTLYGGEYQDKISGIDLDSHGDIIIAGFSDSRNDAAAQCSPSTDGGLPRCYSGIQHHQDYMPGSASDAFIAKFSHSTKQMLWGTRLGGPDVEYGYYMHSSPRVEVNSIDRIFVIGQTNSGSSDDGLDYANSFPTLPFASYYSTSINKDYEEGINNWNSEVFIMGFENTGEQLWSTYFGGRGTEFGENDSAGDIISDDGKLYICGSTSSNINFPLHRPNLPNPYYQDVLGGGFNGEDAFIAQVRIDRTQGIPEMQFTGDLQSVLYPNPNKGSFMVSWVSKTNGKTTLKLYNQLGQVLDTRILDAKEGTNSLELNYNNLNSGIYFVTLENGFSSKTHKLVIR